MHKWGRTAVQIEDGSTSDGPDLGHREAGRNCANVSIKFMYGVTKPLF